MAGSGSSWTGETWRLGAWGSSQRFQDAVRREGHRAHPDTRGVEDGVADRRRHQADSRLTRARRIFLRAIDQRDLDSRNLRERQNLVAGPVKARHQMVVPGHLLLQRTTGPLDHVTLGLIREPIRVDVQLVHQVAALSEPEHLWSGSVSSGV